MVYKFLSHLDAQVATYIPDRYKEGYGVSFEGIQYAHDNDISLIIALDCGIKAVDKVAFANEKGIDFIICDHHLPGSRLPAAVAVLDPKRKDCAYPYKELCGCGVGFKLLQALCKQLQLDERLLWPYLDLVATAIGADIVPITGENRILTYYGLKIINTSPRAGFKAILETVRKRELTVTDVVFILGPRINAAGRMKHGDHAVALLTEANLEQARVLAKEIEQFNALRRETDQQITQEALLQIETNNEHHRHTTVVYHESWHKGVIGIVASRLTETYYRPTLVFTKSGDFLAASARSVAGFDVYAALEACGDHILQFGGHKYAAGLTLLQENYLSFKEAFERTVAASIDKRLLTPEIEVDAEITLKQITPKFYRILKQFAPFGPGNRMPVFMSQHLFSAGGTRKLGKEEKHLRVQMRQAGGPVFSGIGFGLGEKIDVALQGPFKAVYCIDENEWQGQVSLQLRLKDLK